MKSDVRMDLLQYISLQITALKFSGIWFYIPHSTNSFRFWTNLLYRILVGIFVFIVPTGAQIISLIKLIINEAEIQEIAAIINLVLTELLTSFKLLDLCLRRQLLMNLVEQMNNENFTSVPKINLEMIEKSIRYSKWLYILLCLSSVSDIFVHVIVVPALDGFRTLPLKMDFLIFDGNEYFQYICAYQILYKPMMILTFATLQSFPWVFMICAIGQFDVLIYNFENMQGLIEAAKSERNSDENEAFESVFKKCLRHHCVIKRFVNTLEATFSGQFSSTLALNAAIICTTAVQILSIESPLQNIMEIFWVFLYLFVLILILYIDCYLGNYVTIKSGRISTAVYNCPWVNLKTELKRSIVIFISETQQPLEIRAGMKLLPISLETFTKVMNWTYKGFALMNQMKE